MTMTVLLALHIVAATIWVGGMFFAYAVLRPAVGGIEPATERARLWRRVFHRFFLLVTLSVLVLLATGYGMLFLVFGGFAGAGVYIHIMHAIGWIMFLAYGHLRFAAWPKFRNAVDAGDFDQAGKRLALIRKIVLVNLVLGMITVVIAGTGPYWP